MEGQYEILFAIRQYIISNMISDTSILLVIIIIEFHLNLHNLGVWSVLNSTIIW